MEAGRRAERRVREPWWARGPKVPEITTLVVIGLAAVVEFISILVEGDPLVNYLGAVLVVGGTAVGYRYPYVGLALVALGPLVAVLLGRNPTADWSMACFAAFLLALRGLSGMLAGIVIGAANFAAVGLEAGTVDVSANPVASIAAFAAFAAAAVGTAVRGQQQQWFELEQRTRDAIATREAAVKQGVAEERVRIARDLHDSIGHEIAVVSMHLGSAEVHLQGDPDAARGDLAAARAGVQAVLRETQQVLRVLRVGEDAGTLDPTPDHTRIPALIDSFRTAGLEVEARLGGLARPLPPEVSVAAYRISQEALTNAQRYGSGSVSLRIDVSDAGAVVIEAVNPHGTGSAESTGPPGATSGGNGLVGMRERAESTGGRLEVRDDGRLFRIRADLPATQLPANEEADA